MLKTKRYLAMGACAAFCAASAATGAHAQAPLASSVPPVVDDNPASAAWPRALLPDTQSFVIESGAEGLRYRIWLYLPRAAPAAREPPQAPGETRRAATQDAAPPLLVLLDGNATFALAVSAARLQQRVIGPVMIAAIAANNDTLFDESQRFRDYTTPSPDGWGVPRDARGVPLATGGAPAFEALLNERLPAAIAQRTGRSPARKMLFGHSLGGFLVLHDALSHPGAYSRYMAASPSLWWSGAELVAQVKADARAATARATGRPAVALAIRLGGDEQRLAADASAARIERVTHAAMLDNARTFAQVVNQAPALGFDVDLQVYAGQNHVSYLPAAISEAVALAAAPETVDVKRPER
ncbi:alpha/beta hydrolase [Paraburkholderia acidisoli]|uniref:Ferri-bacillibactin esterase BesA n=1 Tax=Paraburkholderia acidisoli TaxID=2571748 RepID=A0A7Z2JHU8_9BURK|nr:alpha/beta hydrolase-fold protein [Paraburkholderia acidisoli]QGZ65106.1 hypothetical protein FAZ98_25320 [Paraburkholderia acidisoli]